jgi:hypothetical protein
VVRSSAASDVYKRQGFKIEKFNKKLNYKKPPLKNNGGKKHKKVIFALS